MYTKYPKYNYIYGVSSFILAKETTNVIFKNLNKITFNDFYKWFSLYNPMPCTSSSSYTKSKNLNNKLQNQCFPPTLRRSKRIRNKKIKYY